MKAKQKEDGYITWGFESIKSRGRSIITLTPKHTQAFHQKPNPIYFIYSEFPLASIH